MNKKVIYMNFPICFLGNAFLNIENVVIDIMSYSTFKHSQSLDFGLEIERMKSAVSFFEISFGDLKDTIRRAKTCMREMDIKTPNASVNISVLWDYLKNPKKEFDIACFCAFCGIKSILGGKEYAKTNKSLIIARMFGFSSLAKKDIEHSTFSTNESGDFKKLKSEMITKYSTRYHIDRVLMELQLNWGLRLYSDHSRGFYLSFSKSLEELAMINIKSKNKSKEKILADQKAKAKDAALIKLGLK